jgi:phosphopantothenoylcysteine decarboxylase/phosphopantothenate--cysteine ligase
MGYALADAVRKSGHRVTLISGPVSITPPKNVTLIKVVTANQMCSQVLKHVMKTNVFISCAAVSDYKVDKTSAHKLKKNHHPVLLKLVPTTDILSEVNSRLIRQGVRHDKILVGFALETDNLIMYAYKKLIMKNLDMIVANPVQSIDNDYTRVTIINRYNETIKPRKMKKTDAAEYIWSKIGQVCSQK